jgi:7-cyano-7-deazaguanine reductase
LPITGIYIIITVCDFLTNSKTGKKMSEAKIELFDNPEPGREYSIKISCPEFTSLCPKTGQPDFGTIIIEYCPDKKCIELKSLKYYMQNYRNKGIFYEALTNQIIDDLAGAAKPRWMKVTSRFTPRGGITTEVTAEYKQ